MKALEMNTIVGENQQIQIQLPIPVKKSTPVRIIVLLPEDNGDVDEREWLSSIYSNSAFNFLHEPSEDIYCNTDGVKFRDEV